jgi:PAS domain S-box-containing protein
MNSFAFLFVLRSKGFYHRDVEGKLSQLLFCRVEVISAKPATLHGRTKTMIDLSWFLELAAFLEENNMEANEISWVVRLIQAGAIATAIGAIYRFLWVPGKKFVRSVLSATGDFYDKVAYISAELKPNGGHSVKDQVTYIKEVVKRIDQRQLNSFQFEIYGIMESDERGNLVWANHAYLDLVGRHSHEMMGQGWRNAICEREREHVVREWEAAVRDKRDFHSKFNMVTRTNAEIPVEFRCLSMKEPDGKLLGHLGLVVRTDALLPACKMCLETELVNRQLELHKDQLEAEKIRCRRDK